MPHLTQKERENTKIIIDLVFERKRKKTKENEKVH